MSDARSEPEQAATPQALPCVFRAPILAQVAGCALIGKQSVAEREAVLCTHMPAHLNCETLERLLFERATFPLHLKPGAPMTHATVMRVQAGGLRGLQHCLGSALPDVHAMVQQAQLEHGSLQALPWDTVVAHILAWQARRRSGQGES